MTTSEIANQVYALQCEREALTQAVADLYNPSDRCGSRRWQKCNTARQALSAWDTDHAPLVAALAAARAEADHKAVLAMGDWAGGK